MNKLLDPITYELFVMQVNFTIFTTKSIIYKTYNIFLNTSCYKKIVKRCSILIGQGIISFVSNTLGLSYLIRRYGFFCISYFSNQSFHYCFL